MMSFGSFHLTLRKLRDLGWHLPRSPTSPFADHSLRPHVTLLPAQAHTPSASLCSPFSVLRNSFTGLRHCPLLNLTASTLSSTWLPTGSKDSHRSQYVGSTQICGYRRQPMPDLHCLQCFRKPLLLVYYGFFPPNKQVNNLCTKKSN